MSADRPHDVAGPPPDPVDAAPAWIAHAAAALCLASGVFILARWQLGLEAGGSGFRMNPTTALCFLLCGASLMIRTPHAIGALLAAATATVGLWNLLVVSGADLPRVDRLVLAGPLDAAAGRVSAFMAPSTSANLVLCGGALLVLHLRGRAGRAAADTLALASLAAVLVPLLGHAYGATSVAGIHWFVPMALSTAVTFVVLGAGILAAAPSGRLVRLLRRDDTAGMVARRLVPAAAALPVALGFLRLLGQRAGLFDPMLGLVLFTVAIVIVLATGGWITAAHIARVEDRRRAAERDRAYLASLVESSDDAIFSVSLDATILSWNPGAERLYGHAAAEAVGQSALLLLPEGETVVPAEIRERLERTGPMRDYERTHRRKDGSTVQVSMTLSPVLDESGRMAATVAVSRDVSERNRQQQRIAALNDALQERAAELARANSELQAFSYSVSHDLRAPLRHIDGFADLLTRHARESLDEKGRRYLDTISSAARGMGQLIDDLLVFSRISRTMMNRVEVDLNTLVAEIRESPGVAAPGRAIDWAVGDLPVVYGDHAMLRVVFTNLLSNAVKYTRTRDRARIEVGASRHGDEQVIHIRDNGVGFDMNYAGKLFGVFQRLHDDTEFEGTGIGLASVRRIVHRHGGRTWAVGVPEQGATLFVALPAGRTATAATGEEETEDERAEAGAAG